jgi:hypothetical protein
MTCRWEFPAGFKVIEVHNNSILIYSHNIDRKCYSKGGDAGSFQSATQEFGFFKKCKENSLSECIEYNIYVDAMNKGVAVTEEGASCNFVQMCS